MGLQILVGSLFELGAGVREAGAERERGGKRGGKRGRERGGKRGRERSGKRGRERGGKRGRGAVGKAGREAGRWWARAL
jgi:hypothetical protein